VINAEYVRAEYDKDRGSYISIQADWINGEPDVEYRFTLQEAEDKPQSWQGGLEKLWRDEEGRWYGEVFAGLLDRYSTWLPSGGVQCLDRFSCFVPP
jgi:hypothetical protein